VIKAKITLTLENENGSVSQDVYTCEGKDLENVEKKLVTQIFVDSGAKVVDTIYEMPLPEKKKTTRAKKKAGEEKQLPAATKKPAAKKASKDG
jgi:hypothetical protein